jgi:hypothetical protein
MDGLGRFVQNSPATKVDNGLRNDEFWSSLFGGFLEYPHRSPASRRKLQKWNPVP